MCTISLLPSTLPNPIVLQDPVVWPVHFLDIQEIDPGTRTNIPFVIGSFDPQKVAEVIGQRARAMITETPPIRSLEELLRKEIDTMDIKVITIDLFCGKPYWLALGGGFHVFPVPLESRSKKKGSGAVYYAVLVWNKVLKLGLLIQVIPACRVTSSHDHEVDRWIERNSVIKGEVELRTRDGQHRLIHQLTEASPVGPILEPQVTHQLSTNNASLLSEIEIAGDPRWYDGKWLTGRGHQFKPL